MIKLVMTGRPSGWVMCILTLMIVDDTWVVMATGPKKPVFVVLL